MAASSLDFVVYDTPGPLLWCAVGNAFQSQIYRNMFSRTPRFIAAGFPSSNSMPASPPSPAKPSRTLRISSSICDCVLVVGSCSFAAFSAFRSIITSWLLFGEESIWVLALTEVDERCCDRILHLVVRVSARWPPRSMLNILARLCDPDSWQHCSKLVPSNAMTPVPSQA